MTVNVHHKHLFAFCLQTSIWLEIFFTRFFYILTKYSIYAQPLYSSPSRGAVTNISPFQFRAPSWTSAKRAPPWNIQVLQQAKHFSHYEHGRDTNLLYVPGTSWFKKTHHNKRKHYKIALTILRLGNHTDEYWNRFTVTPNKPLETGTFWSLVLKTLNWRQVSSDRVTAAFSEFKSNFSHMKWN